MAASESAKGTIAFVSLSMMGTRSRDWVRKPVYLHRRRPVEQTLRRQNRKRPNTLVNDCAAPRAEQSVTC